MDAGLDLADDQLLGQASQHHQGDAVGKHSQRQDSKGAQQSGDVGQGAQEGDCLNLQEKALSDDTHSPIPLLPRVAPCLLECGT